jgi:hypothetical protein
VFQVVFSFQVFELNLCTRTGASSLPCVQHTPPHMILDLIVLIMFVDEYTIL